MFWKKKTKKQKKKKIQEIGQGEVDPEMNYCPVCGDEYRSDIGKCVSCAVALISGKEKFTRVQKEQELRNNRSMEISVDDELIDLRKGALHDMKQLQTLLAGDRIPSILVADESCGRGCCGTEMYLQIRKGDMDAAMVVLSREYIKNTSLENHDLSHVDAVFVQEADSNICPACGCRFGASDGLNCPECGLCFGVSG
ncbi:zinc ribbon-containing (seleno)protein DG [Desulfomarina sp.]